MRGAELDEEREDAELVETHEGSVGQSQQKMLSMSQRFILRTGAIALPSGIVAGLLAVLILAPEKTAAKWLAGGIIGLVAGIIIWALAGGTTVVMYVLPLEKLERFAQQLKMRDFRHEINLGKRNELQSISAALNTMLRSVRDILNQMHGVSDNLADSSGLMASVAKETSDAVSATSSTISQLARGTEDQASSMMVASSTISQMAEEIDRVAVAAREVAKYSMEARATVENGADAVGRATEKMGALVETTGISAQAVRDLGERSEQIGLIVDVITDIADQTNLLALNAAIEAARAGEHGKGFAVVAGEVRKLAEGSARAGSQIAQIIREIQRTINETVVLMENSTKEAGEGARVVGDTGHALESIKSAVETIGAETNAISEATDSIADGSAKVVEIISSVASISEESSSGTQEVSASIEEQTASMQEITAAAMELAETADRLKGLIESFSTG